MKRWTAILALMLVGILAMAGCSDDATAPSTGGATQDGVFGGVIVVDSARHAAQGLAHVVIVREARAEQDDVVDLVSPCCLGTVLYHGAGRGARRIYAGHHGGAETPTTPIENQACSTEQ